MECDRLEAGKFLGGEGFWERLREDGKGICRLGSFKERSGVAFS